MIKYVIVAALCCGLAACDTPEQQQAFRDDQQATAEALITYVSYVKDKRGICYAIVYPNSNAMGMTAVDCKLAGL